MRAAYMKLNTKLYNVSHTRIYIAWGLRPCYGPLFPARAKRAPPSAARASRARNKGTVTWAHLGSPGFVVKLKTKPLLLKQSQSDAEGTVERSRAAALRPCYGPLFK